MMTEEDYHAINTYLKGLKIDEKEFYEEMYDHISSSYERRQDIPQTVEEHIEHVIAPAFGGETGMLKVQQEQTRTRRKLVMKRALQLFGSYFLKWPTVLITGLLTLLLLLFSRMYEAAVVFENTTTVGLLIPYFVSCYGRWRFKRACKQLKMPYSKSAVNERINALSSMGLAIIFGVFAILEKVFGLSIDFFDLFSLYPPLYIPVSMFLIVYSLVCLQLFKEKFQIKLA